MPAGRPRTPLILTDDERSKLSAWSRRPKTAQRLALRARIVLAAADGRTNTAIAAHLRATLPTVGKWRKRFLAMRLDGLTDEPRPDPPRTIADARVEEVIAKTLEAKPTNHTVAVTASQHDARTVRWATRCRVPPRASARAPFPGR